MTTLEDRVAIVTGGGSGVGRATVLALAAEGTRVIAVGRTREPLEKVQREASGRVEVRTLDATDQAAMGQLIAETAPDILVLSAGVRPKMALVHELSWESFSEPWNTDVKIAFQTGQEAIRRPLKPGSLVIIVSSGAGLHGSPLSGGYAGAKRTQMFLASYLQRSADAAKLGIRFVAVVPKQILPGTEMGDHAISTYAGAAGLSIAKFMERFGTPLLTAEGVARTVVGLVRGEVGQGATVLGVTGQGTEAL